MLLSQQLSNQYYIYITPEQGAIPWDIYDPNPENRGFVTYFGKVLQTVEESLGKSGLVFYITMSEMQELPSYGKNVVVLILGDEHYRIPQYIHRVGAVFKCYGTSQQMNWLSLLKPSYSSVINLIQYGSNLSLRLPLIVNYHLQRLKSAVLSKDGVAPIYDIPAGYYNSENLPIKKFEERSFDVFFDGSVKNSIYSKWSPKNWLKTPKIVSRSQMLENLERFSNKHPQFQVQLAINPAFNVVSAEAASSYSSYLMNTKICLVPRGTTLETYRFFEAMRYGCIVVAESLPDRWYYQGLPIIQVKDWRNLEAKLLRLLQDEQLMQKMHQQALWAWETRFSEKAAGYYIAETLNALEVQQPERYLERSYRKRNNIAAA